MTAVIIAPDGDDEGLPEGAFVAPDWAGVHTLLTDLSNRRW